MKLGPYELGPTEDEHQGIYTGDARELAKAIPDESANLILTDPPFFLPATHYQSRVGWQRKWSDVSVLVHWWDMMCAEFARVLVGDGYTLTFCNADAYAAFYPAMYNRWDRLTCLVWDKLEPGLGWTWRHQHEMILVACNSGAYRPEDGKLRADVLHYKATPSKEREHPVQKPVPLLRDIIRASCPRGGIVLDPFCGSGTTLEAAVIAGCSCLGFEKDKGYVATARERVRNSKPPLFVTQPEQLFLEGVT